MIAPLLSFAVRQAIPFGKYLLLDRISVGGMAEVFKAKSYGVEGFEKVIAIKRILPSMGEDREFIKMFIDEAKIVGQLAHANICQIFELGRTEGAHFIAMEYIWGKDLLQIQNRARKLKQPIPVPMACFIVAKVLEGLDYAHKKRDALGRPLEIVHRDCSPQNVLISYEGEVKIIDFGIAKAASRSSKTQAGVLKGKFGYMSPEQVRGLPLDRRSDVFAAGTILYECLSGDRLFVGETDFSTLEKVRNVDIPRPRQVNPAIPEAVEAIIMKALAKDSTDRYQWAGEMVGDLQRFLMSQDAVFTAKTLSSWLKDGFAPEIDRERQQHESFKKLGREGLIGGVPQAEAKLDVVEHLGEAGKAEEPTILGGPSFDDIIDEAVAASGGGAASAGPAPGSPATRGKDDEFAEEGPTEIFGEISEVGGAPAPGAPAAAPAVVLAPNARRPQTVNNRAESAPPTPPQRPMTPPPSRAEDPTISPLGMMAPPIPMAQPAPAPIQGAPMQGAPMHPGQMPPAPMHPGQMPPAPMHGAPPHGAPAQNPNARTMLGMLAPSIPGHPAAAPPQPPPPLSANMPLAAPPVTGGGPAVDPNGYPIGPGYGQPPPQYGQPYPQPPQQPYGQPYGAQPQPYGSPSGDAPPGYGGQPPYGSNPPYPPQQPQQPYGYPGAPSGPQYAATPMASMPGFDTGGAPPPVDVTARRRKKPSLAKDVMIGVAIAAVVLGAFAVVKFVVLADKKTASTTAAVAAATLDVTVTEGSGGSGPAEVFVDGASRGLTAGGKLALADLAAGKHDVKIVRAGSLPCESAIELTAGVATPVPCELKADPAATAATAPIDAGVEASPDAAEVPADAAVAVVADAAPPPIDATLVAVVDDDDRAGSGSSKPSGSGSGSSKPSGSGSGSSKPSGSGSGSAKPTGSGSGSGSGKGPSGRIDLGGSGSGSAKPTGSGSGSSKPTGSGSGSSKPTGSGSGSSKPSGGSSDVAAGEGYLIAYTTPFASISVDGTARGTTPITPRQKIALSPGIHKVLFKVGSDSWVFRVKIEAGKTTTLSKDLPVKQ